MMKKKFILSKSELNEINTAYNITLNPHVKRRLTVLRMHGQGKLIREIAAATNYESYRTSFLVRQYKNSGIKAIFGNDCMPLSEIAEIESALKTAQSPWAQEVAEVIVH